MMKNDCTERHRYHGRGSQVFQFVDKALAGNKTPSPLPVEASFLICSYVKLLYSARYRCTTITPSTI